MMEHAGANDKVEGPPELGDFLDREPMRFQVRQIVFSLKFARVAQARLADIDRGDPGIGFAKRISGGLRCTATGHENFQPCA